MIFRHSTCWSCSCSSQWQETKVDSFSASIEKFYRLHQAKPQRIQCATCYQIQFKSNLDDFWLPNVITTWNMLKIFIHSSFHIFFFLLFYEICKIIQGNLIVVQPKSTIWCINNSIVAIRPCSIWESCEDSTFVNEFWLKLDAHHPIVEKEIN